MNKTLLPHHIDHLKTSGLSDETIQRSGCYSITSEEEWRAILGSTRYVSLPALVFPYGDNYARVRPDKTKLPNPDYRETGHGLASNGEEEFIEIPKYLAPSGVASRLYIPSFAALRVQDPKQDLWITEGEKKALALAECGFAVVAGAGVTMFRNAEARRRAKQYGQDSDALHPDFASIPLEGRKVVICFDSDISVNRNVAQAAVALARSLHRVGAIPHIAYVPDGDSGAKQGVDDYYASLSPEERSSRFPLGEIEDSVRPFGAYDQLDWLVENWDDWFPERQRIELQRAVWLASFSLPGKYDFSAWLRRAASRSDGLGIPQRDIRALLPQKEPESESNPEPPNVREWFAAWRETVKATYSPSDRTWLLDGWPTNVDALLDTALLDSQADGSRHSKTYLASAFSEYEARERQKAIQATKAALAFSPSARDDLPRFVELMTGRKDEVDVAVMRHFIWQVKRKLSGLPVKYHMMPILTGPQGIGKSTSVKRLFGPLGLLWVEKDSVREVTDERAKHLLADAFVVFFDEMAHAAKADVDELKGMITGDRLAWRVLGTNAHAFARNNATFIGCSNRQLYELIYDPTGLRRFYQIECHKPSVEQWKELEELDYLGIWQSVSELSDPPVYPYLEQIGSRQEEHRIEDVIELFAQEVVSEGDNWIEASEVYSWFVEFCDAHGYQKKDNRWFSRGLRRYFPPHCFSRSAKGALYKLKRKDKFATLFANTPPR